MRKLFGILAAAGLLVATSTATAAPVPTTATLGIAIPGLGATFTVTGAGTVSTTGGGAVVIPAGLVQPATTFTVALNSTLVNNAIITTGIANLAGTLSPNGITAQLPAELACTPTITGGGAACNAGGGVGGALGLGGTINITGLLGAMIPLGTAGANIGVGGSANLGLFQFDSAGWTNGVATVQTVNGPTNITGTAGTFVTPVFVNALGNALPIFAVLTLDALAAPEPGTLLLLGAGVAGLAVASRRRK